MPANVQGMVREAMRAIKAGNKAEARALLEKALELEENNEQAWMWLSAVVDSVDEQIVCLENVIYLNPDNANARRGLESLRAQHGIPEPEPEPDDRPLFEPEPDTYGSSAPAFDTFDLNGGDSTPAFDTFDLNDSDSAFSDDARSLLGDDNALADDFNASAFDDASFGDSSYSDTADADDSYDDEPAISLDDRVGGSSVFTADVEDMFGEDLFSDDDFSSEAIPEADLNDFFAPAATMSGGAPAFTDTVDDFASDVPVSRAAFTDTSGLDDGPGIADDDFSEFEDDDEPEWATDETTRLFNMIPAEIKATRLPGISESHPRSLLLTLSLLALLNVLALAWLVLNLT